MAKIMRGYTEFSSYRDMKDFFSVPVFIIAKHVRRLNEDMTKRKRHIRNLRKQIRQLEAKKLEDRKELLRLLAESEKMYKEQGWHRVDPNADLSSIGMDHIEDVKTQGMTGS